jgi:hypothetical protein
VVTVTLKVPVEAVGLTKKLALSEVELVTLTPLTVTPLPLTLTVAPVAKFAPVKVSLIPVPISPVVVLSDVRVGGVFALGVIVAPGEGVPVDAAAPPGTGTLPPLVQPAAKAKRKSALCMTPRAPIGVGYVVIERSASG